MMSMKGVMILFALFSFGRQRPGKHFLIETEDSGDDLGGVVETKSKIQDNQLPSYYYYSLSADLMENKRSPFQSSVSDFDLARAQIDQSMFHDPCSGSGLPGDNFNPGMVVGCG